MEPQFKVDTDDTGSLPFTQPWLLCPAFMATCVAIYVESHYENGLNGGSRGASLLGRHICPIFLTCLSVLQCRLL